MFRLSFMLSALQRAHSTSFGTICQLAQISNAASFAPLPSCLGLLLVWARASLELTDRRRTLRVAAITTRKAAAALFAHVLTRAPSPWSPDADTPQDCLSQSLQALQVRLGAFGSQQYRNNWRFRHSMQVQPKPPPPSAFGTTRQIRVCFGSNSRVTADRACFGGVRRRGK